MKYLDPSFSVPMSPNLSHPKAGDWGEIFKDKSMRYYTIDETGYKEEIGYMPPTGEWYWKVDPFSVRRGEEVVDENGVEHILSDLVEEEDDEASN